MALTAGTVAPLAPRQIGRGLAVGADIMALPVGNAQTVKAGDIIVQSSGKMAVDNTVPGATNIIGIAVNGKASIASAGDSDLIEIALALPGAIFVGSLVGTDKDTDLTAPGYTTAHLYAGDASAFDLDVPTGGTFAVIISGATAADNAVVCGYAREQLRGANFVSGSGGTVNPRVYFFFQTSLWHNLTS